MSRSWHWVYVVAGFLCLLAFGLIVGAYLEHRDAPPPQLAPPEPPVLAVGVEPDPAPPMTCDELRIGRDRWLSWASREALGVETRKGFAATALAWATAAAAECEP